MLVSGIYKNSCVVIVHDKHPDYNTSHLLNSPTNTDILTELRLYTGFNVLFPEHRDLFFKKITSKIVQMMCLAY